MRKFGFIFLFIGFFWLAFLQLGFSTGAGVRPIVLAQYAKLSSDPDLRYEKGEVAAIIRDTAASVYSHAPGVLVPALLMLLGGLLIANGPRRGDNQDAA